MSVQVTLSSVGKGEAGTIKLNRMPYQPTH